MGREACQTPFVNSNLPDYIQKQLDGPAPGNPGRHQAWIDLSLQMVGERIPDDVIFRELRAWIPDKDKSDKELWDCIEGAHARNPQPAGNGGSFKIVRFPSGTVEYDRAAQVIRFKATNTPAPAEIPTANHTTVEWMQAVFKPGEIVCATNWHEEFNGKLVPGDKGTFWTVEKWAEEFGKRGKEFLSGQAGAWVRVNPIKDGDKSGSDASISDYRHLLVEFDSKPKIEQWHVYKESRLPIACVIDSGGKSLHAWVRVEAKTLEEFRERQKKVYEYLGDYIDDRSNINPSRFSRLPGVRRGQTGQLQSLVAVNIGAASWSEFEEQITDDGLPEFEDLADVFNEDVPEPKHVVQNCIRKGQVVILGGPAKSRKSWTVMKMALAVSQGGKFLKWDCNDGKVCYVDTELEKYDLKTRFEKIAKAKGFNLDHKEITKLRLRGKTLPIEKLVEILTRRLKDKGYDLIVIDSIYLLLGNREENSNEDIADLGSWLHKLAVDLNVAIVFTHHFSKGSQVGKRGIEKFSGAGAWGRIVDSAIAMDPNPQNDCFNIEPDFRTFAPQKPFVVRCDGPVWTIDNTVKVASKQASGAADIDDLLQVLDGQTLSLGDWYEQAIATLPMKLRTFTTRHSPICLLPSACCWVGCAGDRIIGMIHPLRLPVGEHMLCFTC